MALTDNQKQEIVSKIMQELSRNFESSSFSKEDLKNTIDSLEEFLETNASAVNSAIPQPARTLMTTKQKAMCLAYVALRRYG